MKKVYIRNYILLIFASILLPACSLEKREGESAVKQPVELVIRASQGGSTRAMENVDDVIEVGAELAPSTRTELGNGPGVNTSGDVNAGAEQQIRWVNDDQIMVWAEPAVSPQGYAFEQKVFSLAYYNHDYHSADFSAMVASTLDRDYDYTYYAIYPSPKYRNSQGQESAVSGITHNGTEITYTLSATQSGEYNPAYDIMWGKVTGAALIERDDSGSVDVWRQPELHMKHLLHMMRIRVPENRNLLGRDVKRLEITFPQAVVGGTAKVNVVTGAVEWSGQSNKVTIDLADENLLDEGGRYVWVQIKPGTINGDLKFRAYGADGVPSEAITTNLNNRNFQAGHITPINLTIPTELEPVIVNFSCPDNDSYPNFLGEAATVMHIKSGPAALAEKSTIVASSGNGVFGVKFYYVEGEVNTDLVGQTINVGFESAHADVSDITFDAKVVSMGSASDSRQGYYALPYLFFEDFSSAANVSSNDNNGNDTDGIHDTFSGISLNDYGLTGWSGASVGVQEGTSARVCGRFDNVSVIVSVSYRKVGRIDTKSLKIKNSTSADVSVTFNYSAGRNKDKNVVPDAVCGYTTKAGVINGVNNGGDTDKWTISGATDIAITNYSGSYTSIGNTKSYIINNCTDKHRLSWEVSTTGRDRNSNSNTWLYIDNIKVSVGGSTKHTGKNYRSFFPNHIN